MSLADDIRALRDQSLADLAAALDYFEDTKIAWEIVETAAAGGATLSRRNILTGNTTTETTLLAKGDRYVNTFLAQATFQQFLATFESFFFDLLRLWLTAYPQSLAAKEIPYRVVLDAPDKDAITRHVVDRELNEIAYKRLDEWFAYLQSRTKVDPPSADDVDQLAEAKASRDVIVHNAGIANKVYLQKAGRLARFRLGQTVEITGPYHRLVWQLAGRLVGDLGTAAVARAE